LEIVVVPILLGFPEKYGLSVYPDNPLVKNSEERWSGSAFPVSVRVLVPVQVKAA